MKSRTPEEWKTLRLTDPDAYALAIDVDEIERNGGIPIVTTRDSLTAAPPVPPQPDCYSKAEIDGRTQ
jgi:hypothetical protein